MFEFEACEVLNNNKFTLVNVCFHNKRIEEIGYYRQTYNTNNYSHSIVAGGFELIS